MDQLLLPYLQASNESERQQHLDELLLIHAVPVVRQALRQKLGFHVVKRIFIAASGSLALLLFAANLIGLGHVARPFISGFAQFFSGAVMPFNQGQYLLHRLSDIATRPVPLLALMAVKMAAFNLLPLPVLNGGYVILEIVRLVITIPERIVERLNQVGFLIVIAVMCGWIVAIIYFLVH